MRVFYPDGTECESMKAFLNFYSRSYYLENSWSVEERIKALLYDHKMSFDKKELHLILAWKSGRIKYLQSKGLSGSEPKIVYAKGWQSPDEKPDSHMINQKLDIEKLTECMKNLKGSEDLKDYLNGLKQFHGIGNTYAITLMCFNTNGKFPIYDQFADKALLAIEKGISPLDPVIVEDAHMSNKSVSACIGVYTEFRRRLEKQFGSDCCKDRRVDQSLWVYGHMFG